MLIPLILFFACANIYASDSDSGSDSNYSDYEYAPVRHARSHCKTSSPVLTRQKMNLKKLSVEEKKARRRKQNRIAAAASRARKKQTLALAETTKKMTEANCTRLQNELEKQAKTHAQKIESARTHISLLTNENTKFQQKIQEMEQAKKQAEENAHKLELQLQQALTNLQQTTQLATQVLSNAAMQHHSLGYAQIESTAYQVDYFV